MKKNNQNEEFLQSAQWREFQEAVGRKTFHLEKDSFSASLIEHALPIVGKYLYCPRGPITSLEGEEFPTRLPDGQVSNNQSCLPAGRFPIKSQFPISNDQIKFGMQGLIELAKKEKAAWIRIDPENEQALELIKENISEKILKAPHDMQPKEIFVVDISKSEEQLLSEMKPKTRYNINLAKKKGVEIVKRQTSNVKSQQYVEDFLRLTKEMAARQGITAHPEQYYRKMIESLPEDMLKIYVAEFGGPASTRGDDRSSTRGGKIIAANLVLFYDGTATYLHGASGNEHRNLMAPFLLQWQAILDAKRIGCTKYDFGGVKTSNVIRQTSNSWEGITNFKLGFSPNTTPIEFSGSYDIIINPRKYAVYRGLQRAKAFAVKFRK